MMQKLRGSPKIIVLLFYYLCLWVRVTGLCPVRCECNDKDDLRVICDSANLDVVPITLNPGLRELRLSNNHIKGVRSSFSVYLNLEFLDMSRNQLSTLDKDNFRSIQHLKTLLLNHNMISDLQNDTFTGLHALEKLNLCSNLLQEIKAKVFVYLENLEELELSQNQIVNIEAEAFFGLKNLKTLVLRNNNLTFIPSLSFQYIPKLLKLDLGLNLFEEVPENSFSSLNNLQELLLDGCGIRIIYPGAFKWLNSLLILQVQNNELNQVPTRALFDVIRLEEIHIGQNNFFHLKARAFQRLQFLHTVVIDKCPKLEMIEKDTFLDNTNLKTVIIRHNKVLNVIQEGAFNNLPNIESINLRANAFETFQHSLFPWDELQNLDVRDNPFVCNCSLLWLWKLLVTKNFTSSDDQNDVTKVLCANPPHKKDQILTDLQETDLDCYSMGTRRQIIIGIVVVGAVTSAAIVMLGFRYRDKVAGVLKTRWSRGRKEPQYQKTSAEEENTILQAAQQSLKLTPVTEL
ncbi:slit homolog 3 protein-like [Uloborus diversus]|uniref:slit homolog 3 protein-like n=1 Tax=Uloborus diversus TaxID=327109 RepID=UPI00240A53C5|nr:slit homolog 3 protein-like [Uloborus diversus]